MKARADTLFYGGKIYTMEAPDICKDAVVLKDGKFAYVGTKEEALEHFDCAKCIDLQGKTVLPGMGDSHLHFFAFCQTYTTVDLGGATSRDEALQLLRDRAAETPKGEWIKGSNFDQSKWKDCEDQLPTRLDLDEASTEHPIVIKRVCLHTAVANTMALEKANITNGYVFGPGGMVELDADGRPNGIFREQASKIYDNLIPDPFLVPTTREKCMKKGLALASSLGVTMMHTYAAAIWHYDEDFADYVARSDRGELPVLNATDRDFFFLRRRTAASVVQTVTELCTTRLPRNMHIPAAEIQVISPTRKGETGTFSLNRALQAALNPPAPDKHQKTWGELTFWEGDRVMQTRNNYDVLWTKDDGTVGSGIFNGDVGVIEDIDPAGELLTIRFDDRTAVYTADLLAELDMAYAMTVHKSQGSEYPAVVLVSAPAAPSLMVRGVLYTAITRARKLLVLVGDDVTPVKMAANDRQQRRYSGLRRRLKEGMA